MSASILKLNTYSNREIFSEEFDAKENGVAIDFTGASIVFCIRDPESGAAVLNASTDDGNITINTTIFTIDFTEAEMRTLCSKQYNIGCTVDLAGDGPVQYFTGTLPIIDGVVP